MDKSSATTEEANLESSSPAEEESTVLPGESAQQEGSTSTVTLVDYHDHFDVKEEDMRDLIIKQSASKTETNLTEEEDPKLPSSDHGETNSAIDSSTDAIIPCSKRKTVSGPRGGVYEPFPLKLHKMLAAVDQAGLTAAVSWKSHGRAFQVNNVNQFVKTILPKFFRQSKLTSFQRQLNLYGFRRIIHGTDSGAYYHELFLRGKPFLCRAMIRTKIKGKSRLRTSDLVESEPDLYKMKPLPLLNADDYSPSKNVLLSAGNSEIGGKNEILPISLDAATSSKKLRSSVEPGSFDPVNNSFTNQSLNGDNDYWADSQVRLNYHAHPYCDTSTTWQSNPGDFNQVGQISAFPSMAPSMPLYQHPADTFLPPQSTNGMLLPPAQNMPRGWQSFPGQSPYSFPQNPYPVQNQQYWTAPPYQHQHQFLSSSPFGFQNDQNSNPYNAGNDAMHPPFSQQPIPNVPHTAFSSYYSRVNQPSQNQYASHPANNQEDVRALLPASKSLPEGVTASASFNAASAELIGSITPIKGNSDATQPLEVDGAMTQFLQDFMNKKEN